MLAADEHCAKEARTPEAAEQHSAWAFDLSFGQLSPAVYSASPGFRFPSVTDPGACPTLLLAAYTSPSCPGSQNAFEEAEYSILLANSVRSLLGLPAVPSDVLCSASEPRGFLCLP